MTRRTPQEASTGQLPGGLTYEEWARRGRRLARMSDGVTWALGDWLVYGQSRFGPRYRDAISGTRLEYQTLRNYAWVARNVPASRRRDGLSFQHHAEVAPLAEAEQDLWLDRAERHHWSRNRLRREIAARRATMRAAKLAVVVRIELPVDRAARWREAADRSAQDLEAWVAHAVDAAAEAVLDGPLDPAGVPRPRLELAPLRLEGR